MLFHVDPVFSLDYRNHSHLIGIVKKNAIMMIDFALQAERVEGKNTRDAIFEACLLRFRPIMMTTTSAICGALPLAFGTGTGSELRRPLGITIVGGLLLSQLLTLYTLLYRLPLLMDSCFATAESSGRRGSRRDACGGAEGQRLNSREMMNTSRAERAEFDFHLLRACLVCSLCSMVATSDHLIIRPHFPRLQRPITKSPP